MGSADKSNRSAFGRCYNQLEFELLYRSAYECVSYIYIYIYK